MTAEHGWRAITPLSTTHRPTLEDLTVTPREPSHAVTVLFYGADFSTGEVRIEGGPDDPVGDSPQVLRAAAAELLATADELERDRQD